MKSKLTEPIKFGIIGLKKMVKDVYCFNVIQTPVFGDLYKQNNWGKNEMKIEILR